MIFGQFFPLFKGALAATLNMKQLFNITGIHSRVLSYRATHNEHIKLDA
jgi:hypothetical protein